MSIRAKRGPFAALLYAASVLVLVSATAAAQSAAPAQPAGLNAARKALTAKRYTSAKEQYRSYLRSHPHSVEAEFGLADAEFGLHQYEAAEWDYRRVVAAQPQLWVAHKNLVIIEAKLGRWDEFDRERGVLRAARQRGADGITARESDVIDTFDVNGHGWIVREYFEPVGRSQARFNFERFSPAGRVEEYVSLEPTAAAQAALKPGDEKIGAASDSGEHVGNEYSLNWYTGKSHGTIARYPKGEPTYERVRSDLMRWLRRK